MCGVVYRKAWAGVGKLNKLLFNNVKLFIIFYITTIEHEISHILHK